MFKKLTSVTFKKTQSIVLKIKMKTYTSLMENEYD